MNVTSKCRNDLGGLIAAGPQYAEALAQIHAAAFPPADCWGAALFAGQLAMPGVFALLDPAGGLVLARTAADEAEILTLGVAAAARRAGRGRALLRAAEAQAAAAGAGTMFLEVAADNAAARALYATAGYCQVGERRGYYNTGTDALVLARAITCAAVAGE